MSDAGFDKIAYQNELSAKLAGLVNSQEAVNDGQLIAFMTYFAGERSTKYSEEEALSFLADADFAKALRLVLIYNTISLTVADNEVFDAALESFPHSEIDSKWAVQIIDVLDVICETPQDETIEHYAKGLPEGVLLQRIKRLRSILGGRFAEML